MDVLEAGETCPWLILGCSITDVAENRKSLSVRKGLGRMILRNLRVAWKQRV
jgi:hypothetical protein